MGLLGGRPSSDPSFALMCSFISFNSDFLTWASTTVLMRLTAMMDVKGLAKSGWFPRLTPQSCLLPSMPFCR